MKNKRFAKVKAHFMRFVLCQHFGTVLYQYCAGLLILFRYKNARSVLTYITIFALQCNWNISTEEKN